MTLTIPRASAVKAWPNETFPDFYILEVKCPYCPKTHLHGWKGPGDPGGRRAAHCQFSGGYEITIPSNFKADTNEH